MLIFRQLTQTHHIILEAINQADTIEELCDEFVIEEYDLISEVLVARTMCNSIEDIEKVTVQKHKIKYRVYGAIWTDKGLIYVAKMNEKGELELL